MVYGIPDGGRGGLLLPNSRAIVLQQCEQCRRAGRMKRRLTSAQTTRSKTISCKGQLLPPCCILRVNPNRKNKSMLSAMNEARLSHLPFWGPSEVLFLVNSTAVGLTRMKRSSFGLRVRVNPWVNLGERFIRVNPTDV